MAVLEAGAIAEPGGVVTHTLETDLADMDGTFV
jgi:hypothetical protein